MSNRNIILDIGYGFYILDTADAIWIDNRSNQLVINHSGRYTHLNCDNPEALLNKIRATFKANDAAVIEEACK